MQHQTMEGEVLNQFLELMDKAGFESVAPVLSAIEQETQKGVDTILINLKALNAKYDKNEAIVQIKCLMDKYNIQLDQLIDRRGIA